MQETTIKLKPKTKITLERLKRGSESYDILINRLISKVKHSSLKKELAECYESRDKDFLSELKEWENASKEVDEQWKY